MLAMVCSFFIQSVCLRFKEKKKLQKKGSMDMLKSSTKYQLSNFKFYSATLLIPIVI